MCARVQLNLLLLWSICDLCFLVGVPFQDGLAAIPDDWKMKVDDYKVMEDLVDKILACRTPVA